MDNIVYRAGFAQSRDQARQVVNHGHILVNGRKVSIPSYRVRIADAITIREGSKTSPYFAAMAPQWLKNHEAPEWLVVDKEKMSASIKRLPTVQDSGVRTDDLQAIIELYSR